jgi:hypothetical protein
MKKSELRKMVREELRRITEDATDELMSGGMKTWWKYDKVDVMRFIYWTQRQLPPHDKALFDKNWKAIVPQLQKRHPAPKHIYNKIMREA